jgi:hypothetical protein
LKDLDDTMLEMIAPCNVSEVVQATKQPCPSLSLHGGYRRKIAKAITAENFAKLKILRCMMAPFTKCVRFFERDDSSI